VKGFGIFTFGIFTIFGIRDFYIWDYFIWEKFVAPTVITIVNYDCNPFIIQASDLAGYRLRLAYQIFISFLNLISLFINHNQLRTKSYNETFFSASATIFTNLKSYYIYFFFNKNVAGGMLSSFLKTALV